MTADIEAMRATYLARSGSASELCERLRTRVQEALDGFPHIDRVAFRPKSVSSFLAKATARDAHGTLRYKDPLREIEDQIAGRVIVFFRDDLDPVTARLRDEMGPIEAMHREPAGDAEFGYESEHFIFVIPSHLKPESWLDDPSTPATFEMQIRTLFMHAWAEPQHELGYKPGAAVEVAREHKRRLAWIAASAWGADQMLNEVARELDASTRTGAT